MSQAPRRRSGVPAATPPAGERSGCPLPHGRGSAERGSALRQLASDPLDVLIAGGGVLGAGIARDAARRGLRVGLVEQHDFAYGTSSRSSRLLHGGLRYLAQGRVGLVREASREKTIIRAIAPHLCEPLAFVFPTFRAPPWASWARWKLRIGVKMYDLLCLGQNFEKSSSLGAGQVCDRFPGIRSQDLTGGVRYFDALTQDARLVIDTLRSAARAGAAVLNYCRLDDAHRDTAERGPWRCILHDRLADERFEVRSRCVVNATGPWAEQLPHSSVRLRLTKGVHLVIDRDRLPIPDAVVMTEGNRILFAIPWGRCVILGTTDTDYNAPIEAVHTEPGDAAYVLGVVNATFPDADLSEADIISTWAGLRPLLADPDGHPSDISRTHEILTDGRGWWDVAGGKLTTYRLIAEQTVSRIQHELGLAVSQCDTGRVPLLESSEDRGFSGILPPDVTREAVEHYCANEWAIHLDDIMVRRAGWHYYHRDTWAIARRVAGWMAGSLGWDAARVEQELQDGGYRAGLMDETPSAPGTRC
jgi:glycerol-3-phosphate dehydrogenase